MEVVGVPPLYGFDDDPDDELELLSEEALDELSALLLSVPPTEVSADVLPETSVLEELEVLDEFDKLDELEELVLVESDSLPELSQPLSSAAIIKAARITDSCFFMSSPLP